MKLINLDLTYLDFLLSLEEKMYWTSGKWQKLWQKEAKEKFKTFIKDYLINFPQGCFGLIDKSGELLGAMFLLKISEVKPIPYIHKVFDYFKKDGKIAYVSFFVVKKGKNEWEIANKLYNHAEKISLKLNCKKIMVVIYSSPLELNVLEAHNYKKLKEKFNWEIYPGKKVNCWIYYSDLLS